ncbi:IS21 family transposase, partial [Mycobacterium sp. ITM-2017-0098]
RQQFQASPPLATGDQLVRDLADYDRAFGVDFTTAAVASDGEVA